MSPVHLEQKPTKTGPFCYLGTSPLVLNWSCFLGTRKQQAGTQPRMTLLAYWPTAIEVLLAPGSAQAEL